MNLSKLKKDTLKQQALSAKEWKDAKDNVIFDAGRFNLIITPNVFTPKTDSVLLAKKMIVRSGDEVLDMCAGSGIQTIYAALVKKAKLVYSCDINPHAVKTIKLNIKKYKLGKRVKVFNVDLFPKTKRHFDVIVANPPYTDHKPKDIVEKSMWDLGHKTLIRLLKNANKYLKSNGRMYISWANFADFGLLEKLIKANNYKYKVVGSASGRSDPRIEYRIYELTPQ